MAIRSLPDDSETVMLQDSQDQLSYNCALAFDVLKGKFSKLVEKIPPEEICDHLLSANLISIDEHEVSVDEREPRKKRTRKLISKVLQAVQENFKVFELFCQALEESEHKNIQEWGKRLRGDFEERLLKDSKASEQMSIETRTEDEALKRLKDELLMIRKSLFQSDVNIEAKYDLAREFVAHYIRMSKETTDSVKIELRKLCFEDFLIPSKLHQWCFDEVKKIREETVISGTALTESPPISLDSSIPLFCKETVYHALLLTKLVQTSSSKNFESFLEHEHHEYDEVSVSLESPERSHCIERYAIAKRGKVLYTAFLGERNISDWQDKYNTINEGIMHQSNRIPIRFFVEKIREGYQIIFTGFSFGGLLAIAVYSSLWCQTCLSIDELKKNVACFAFAPPLVHVDIVAEAMEKKLHSNISFKKNTYLFYIKNDLFPRLFRCIETETEKSLEATSTNGKLYAGSIGSVIMKHLAELQANFVQNKSSSEVTQKHIHMLKKSLKDTLPSVQSTLKLYGTCHLMYKDGSRDGRYVLSILPDQAGADQMNTIDTALIDEIRGDIFKQHSFVKYETVINQSYLHDPEYGAKFICTKKNCLSILTEVKPSVSGVVFSRLGDEIAVVVEGNNLWFCDQIKVGSRHVIDTRGSDASKRSINFNYVPLNDQDLLVEHNAKTVEVCLYSHFSSPIRKKDVAATKKADYHISLRQRQLARNTPRDVITLSFLSALLERPTAKYESSGRRSHRFRSICRFLEDVVRIVPIESIFNVVVNIDGQENAWKCAEVVSQFQFDPPPSLMFLTGLQAAHMRLTLGIRPYELEEMLAQQVLDVIAGGFTNPAEFQKNATHHFQRAFADVVKGQTSHQSRSDQDCFSKFDKSSTLQCLVKMRDIVDQKCRQSARSGTLKVISDLNIEEFYPANIPSSDTKCNTLKPPIAVLASAKKKLSHLQTKAAEEILSSLEDGEDSINKIKKLHNEEMIQLMDDILGKELLICTSLLAAFMEQQIQVPLINSPQETAHILQTTQTPSSVGVWALFSLDMLNLQEMLRSEKGIALIIEVQNYIQGILSKRDDDLYFKNDSRYAGKLQFLMQGMESTTVSCNTSYISYSLERQLHDLCDRFKITPKTRVNKLVTEWDNKFKDSVLFHVMQPFRPLLARWLIWSLNIHQLREELASHTTVGIVGLSNSGKSSLVSSLFKQKVISGTTSIQRTTVPFLYNLEGFIEGLSVIDFPGVDDDDESVESLTSLLLQLAQIVVLVIDYRRCSTVAAKQILEHLDRENVPVYLCLTHADKLYANECLKEIGRDCSNDTASRIIGRELERFKQKIGTSMSRTMDFFSFCQDGDSILNCDEGRETLKSVGIHSSFKVGEWIEKELRDHMQQKEIADALHQFLCNTLDDINFSNEMPIDSDEEADINPLPLPEYIRGVTVSAQTTKIFFGLDATDTFDWDGYGFKMVVPAGALPKGKQCEITVKAITTGQFNFPKHTELVSSVYWIYSSCKFLKPVDVCIDHCAILQSLDDCSQMRFILARCDQDSLPYNFTVKPGTFSPNNREGLISLKSFSFLAAIRNYIFPTTAVTGDVQDVAQTNRSYYVVKVFGRRAVSQRKTWHFDFIFMKDVGPYKKAIDSKYFADGWIEEIPATPFEFQEESLVIQFPERDAFSGWHIAKKNPNKISKKYIDDSTPDSSLQTCRVAFRWCQEGEPPPLDCDVEICDTIRQCQLTLSLPIEETNTGLTSLMPVSEQVSSQASTLTVEGSRVENNPNISVNVHVNN